MKGTTYSLCNNEHTPNILVDKVGIYNLCFNKSLIIDSISTLFLSINTRINSCLIGI